jgi:atypical dual specificity phosphatase
MQSIPAPDWGVDTGRIDFSTGPKPGTYGRLPSRITPQLYLSDYWTARDDQQLKGLGITHVISLLDFNPEIPDCISSEKKLHININDEPRANILQHLPTTTSFIIAAIQENKANKVLVCTPSTLNHHVRLIIGQVHCMIGMSRSPTVVCAYLVATTNRTASESIKHVRSIRAIVYPNVGFQQQLEEYSSQFVKTKAKPASFFVWAEIFSFSSVATWFRRATSLPSPSP